MQIFEKFYATVRKFLVFTNCYENISQLLRKFHLIFEKILLSFKENFNQFLKKFLTAIKKILHNFEKNFIQLLVEFHSVGKKFHAFFKRIWDNF